MFTDRINHLGRMKMKEQEPDQIISAMPLIEGPDTVSLQGMMAELASGEPAEKEMTMKAGGIAFASWTHGVDIQIEYPNNLDWIYRRGFGTQLKGKPDTTNWFHFAVPTPVIVDGARCKLEQAMLRFVTGSVAAIVRHIHVYDGEKRIATHDNVNLTGPHGFEPFSVPGRPLIYWGVGISIGVQFLGGSHARDMWFISAGGDFYK